MIKPDGAPYSTRIPWRTAIGTCALCWMTTSCFTTNSYLVPDALPPGRITLTPAIDGWFFRRKYETPGQVFPERHVDSTGFAFFPHFMARVGIVPSVEGGLDVGPDSPIRGDVKVQLVEGDIGVAVAGVGRFATTSRDPRTGANSMGSVEVPLVVGFRLSSDILLVTSPAFTWVVGRPPRLPETFKRDEAWTRADYVQLALGPVIRANRRFSLFPEVTLMRSVSGPETTWLTVGVGFLITPKQPPWTP
jgi:hypothetical protein